ncbi:MAG: PAS domain-containing protein, partial [Pseudolabrys sp.]
MAHAEVASASAHADSIKGSDSIKGLAQSIARPAYRRLLLAEPALRRAVPVLIIAFLATICVGAMVQVLDHRHQTMQEMGRTLEAAADVTAERIERIGTPTNPQDSLTRAIPAWATGAGRLALLTNAEGLIVAALPPLSNLIGRTLVDILGPAQPLTTFGVEAGVLEIALADNLRALATVRVLHDTKAGGDKSRSIGQLAFLQPRNDALSPWRSLTTLTITLSATTGFVVLILGFAFHWQSTRAREADGIFETVRSRIDTALNRGRCGLWDWDLARGRIFWSQSMFEMLGLAAREDLMGFGEVSTLVHPDDIHLYEIAAELTEKGGGAIDHAFRMRHANGHWVWLRARCELVHQAGDAGPHLIGIAVDVTEQKRLVER